MVGFLESLSRSHMGKSTGEKVNFRAKPAGRFYEFRNCKADWTTKLRESLWCSRPQSPLIPDAFMGVLRQSPRALAGWFLFYSEALGHFLLCEGRLAVGGKLVQPKKGDSLQASDKSECFQCAVVFNSKEFKKIQDFKKKYLIQLFAQGKNGCRGKFFATAGFMTEVDHQTTLSRRCLMIAFRHETSGTGKNAFVSVSDRALC